MSTHEGLALGHRMADLAAEHAGDDWLDEARFAFREYAKRNRFFTTEQVRMANPDLPKPPDARAWGAIPRMAVREGTVTPHGWTRADSRSVHGMVVTLWESKIYKGEVDEAKAN